MKVQFSIASNRQGIVVGTDHSAENITGFYTKYGDGGAVDIAPIFGFLETTRSSIISVSWCAKGII